MEYQLRRMEIEPGEKGGATITHHYKARPVMKKGGMSGGMSMDYPESKQFPFSPEDGEKIAAHVLEHLPGMKKGGAAKPAKAAESEEAL